MKSVTIIISHFESLLFLHTCIRQIRKYKNNLVQQHICIADQSGDEIHYEVMKHYWGQKDITVVRTKSLWSGYGVDYCIRYVDIDTEYVCQMHVDCIPISDKWLYLPIKLIEENNFTFVGQMQLISLPTDTIYPTGKFFSMAAAFNIAKTEDYKELSLNGGFTRYHNRSADETGMVWNAKEWDNWASVDYDHRGSDDDVPAFHWGDQHRGHNKLGLAISGMIHPHYGRIIDGLLFHFCSCREGLSGSLGEQYVKLFQRVQENYDDKLIDELLSMVKPTLTMRREVWDGTKKENNASSEELNNKIERLKQ